MMGSGYVDKELTRASKRAIETLGEKDIYYIFTPLIPNTSTRLILKKTRPIPVSARYGSPLNHGDLKATQGDTGHAEIDADFGAIGRQIDLKSQFSKFAKTVRVFLASIQLVANKNLPVSGNRPPGEKQQKESRNPGNNGLQLSFGTPERTLTSDLSLRRTRKNLKNGDKIFLLS